MVTEVTSYRSNSGTLFDTRHMAERDDLREWFKRVVSKEIATGIVNAICQDSETIDMVIAMLQRIKESRPDGPLAEATPVPLPPMPSNGYRVPAPYAQRVRCGGIACTHPIGTCTADRDYQRWIKAEKLYDEAVRNANTPNPTFRELDASEVQGWLHKAEYAK